MERCFDGGKKVMGGERHVAGDTGGRPLMVNLTVADVILKQTLSGCEPRLETAVTLVDDSIVIS